MIRMDDASRLKRAMFRYFMEVARRVAARSSMECSSVGPTACGCAGRAFDLRSVAQHAGNEPGQGGVSGGEAIGPDLFTFYRSSAFTWTKLYGSTETSVFVACSLMAGAGDTSGPPVAGGVKIKDSGEILLRSRPCSKEYYKNRRPRRK